MLDTALFILLIGLVCYLHVRLRRIERELGEDVPQDLVDRTRQAGSTLRSSNEALNTAIKKNTPK